MAEPLLPTTVVGSYPQPEWLIHRDKLLGRLPPRVRLDEVWKPAKQNLDQAQNEATVIAIHDQERAGIDIISDGEMRRESYSNHFSNALGGIDIENPGTAIERTGAKNSVPRVVKKISWNGPIESEDVRFLRANTSRAIKITLPGPFTMTQQVQDDYYGDETALAMDYAAAVNQEVKASFAAGADVVQLDEPYMQARPEKAKAFAINAINRALKGATGPTIIHMCFGYAHFVTDKPSGYSFLPELEATTADQISVEAAQPRLDLSMLRELPSKKIVLGVINNGDPIVETAETVADRIRAAFTAVPAERVIIAPDCGMKYLDRATAFGKLKAMVDGAVIVRREL
jgi:5-methyltetrahydropteroyltriglutamate--homocysteine methyltransferase